MIVLQGAIALLVAVAVAFRRVVAVITPLVRIVMIVVIVITTVGMIAALGAPTTVIETLRIREIAKRNVIMGPMATSVKVRFQGLSYQACILNSLSSPRRISTTSSR